MQLQRRATCNAAFPASITPEPNSTETFCSLTIPRSDGQSGVADMLPLRPTSITPQVLEHLTLARPAGWLVSPKVERRNLIGEYHDLQW